MGLTRPALRCPFTACVTSSVPARAATRFPARSALACVWFSDDRLRSAFQPQAGLRIVVHGRIDLFEQQGAVQLYVESIQPAGFGDLAIRFEELKARLAAEGLFDPGRKRALPTRPSTIAVITSPTGVVWRDIATVLARRWPLTTSTGRTRC